MRYNERLLIKEHTREYLEALKWCNANNAHLEPKGAYYVTVPNSTDSEPTEEDSRISELNRERMELVVLLQKNDYIGIKIAMGRATIEDYKEEIELSNTYAKRIEEIEKEIDSILNPTIIDSSTKIDNEEIDSNEPTVENEGEE